MKNKVIQKFFTILLGLMMVSPGWAATQYCQTPVQSTIDNTSPVINVTVSRVESSNILHIEFESDLISGIRAGGTFQQWGNGTWKNQDDAVANFAQNWNPAGNVFSKDFEFSTYPTSGGGQIYVLFDLKSGAPAVAGFTLTDVDLLVSCGGGSSDLTPSDLTITSSTELELEASATSQISHTTSSTGAVTYSSSNEGVATVSASGLITAHKGGKATITVAQAADDTYAAGSKKITVTVPRTSQCSGDVGHFGTPSVKRIHYEIEYKDNAIEYTVTGLNSHAIDFLEVHTTKGNYAATLTNGIGTYKQTGLTEGEEIGIRFLYKTDELVGNEMNSENVNLDDPNIIYYKVGDCGAADPGLLTSDLTLTSEAEVEIAINATSQISYTTTSTGAVTYSSSKESVATVSASGLITAHKGGKATITVSQAADATYNAGSLTVEVTVPEVITETTWWRTGSDQGVSVLYSITRNLNKTLTFHVDAWGDVTGIATPQINIKDVYNNVDGDGNYTTTATYETDEVVNLFFYIPFTGAAARIDVAYTVGSENVKPDIEVTGVSIDPASAAVEVGKTTNLTAIIKPAFATNTNISWSVIVGSEYASVDANGVVTGLAAGAATVQVTTESGSKTATCDVNVVAQILLEPNADPAAPTYPAEQVKAVYSSTYSADCGFGYDWGSDTQYTQDTYGKKYVNGSLGYFGMVGFNHNCSQMEKLHLDVWAVADLTFRVVPILKNGAGNNYPEQGVQVSITGQQWNSIDIALSEGNLANYTDWSQTYQIKIDQAANETFWLNNVYFYTIQTKTTCALSASVKGNEGGTASVSIAKVAKGGTATFTAEAARGYSFVGWWNNTTKVSENTTYTPTDIQEDLSLVAEFSFTGPTEAAEVPSDYVQVISIYGAYTPIENVNMLVYWGEWDHTSKEQISVAGRNMIKYGHINFQGIAFEGNPQDVSAMKFVHLDIWSNKEGDIRFYPINASTDQKFVVLHLDECQWNSFDIELSEFGDEFDLTTIRQLKFNAQKGEIGDNGVEGATILVQDIFFYAPNEFTLSETESNETNLEAFNGKACDVTIARSFTAGSLYTLALPFDMTADQVEETFRACTMYKLAESYWKVEGENMYIRFAPVTEFEANTPILFTPATDLDNIVAKEVTINNAACETATTLVTFHGTYSKMNLTAPNYILAADQYLYPVVGDEYSINGMRGYFSFGSVSQAPKMARVILHEEITTDNALVPAAQGATKKVMENGRFVIIRDGKSYNAQGLIIQ